MLLAELKQIDKELFIYENGFKATLLSLFLAVVGIWVSNRTMFSVVLGGVMCFLVALCFNRWSHLFDQRETLKAQIIELRKQIHLLDHYG